MTQPVSESAAAGMVCVRREPGMVRATLSRPDAGNALRPEVLHALHEAVDAAEQDATCRALLIDSAGPQFCSGLDLGCAQLPAIRYEGGFDTEFWRLINRLRETPVVTVSVVDGPATGGGAGLACACDLVVVGDAARFRLTEVFLGLLPGMIMPGLARRIGEQGVFRMALMAEEVDAAAAVRSGLADIHAQPAADGLRTVMLGLRRTDRDTLAELKSLRRLLFPAAAEYGLYAGRLLGRRLDDPVVLERISRFRAHGMLP